MNISKSSTFTRQKHPFHILDNSPFPCLTALSLFIWLVPQTFYLHSLPFVLRSLIIHLGVLALIVVVLHWFFSIIKESGEGYHTKKVQHGLALGMILFIASEVMFFFAFFWAFFHFSLSPSIAVGAVWPPAGTQALNPWGLPLLNTLLLLTSGATVTIAHHVLLHNRLRIFAWYLFATVVLGICFLLCQGFEYKYGVKFPWRENVYGSIFFITTGFHGLHVTVGTLFLLFCLARQIFLAQPTLKLTAQHHFGFTAAAWYWHFVDVVWLFLFIVVYWWFGA